MTTDTSKTARQIINTYELRPEIEEDFRQMKDFWKLENFKSTKYNYITYHIIRLPLFPNIQESGRRQKIFREIHANRNEKLQGDQTENGQYICWAVF